MTPVSIKRIFSALFSLALLFSFVFAGSMPLHAAENQLPPAIVAVVDMQRVMTEAKAAKDVNAQVSTHRKAVQEQLVKLEQELREREQELARQRNLITQEAFIEKQKEYETRRLAGKQLVQRGRAIDAARNKALLKIKNEIALIVAEVAKSHGVTLVLSGDVILLADSKINLTDEVLDKVNKTVAKVKVDIPTQ